MATAPESRLQFHGQYLDSHVGRYLRARDSTTRQAAGFTADDPVTPSLTDPDVASYVFAGDRPPVFGDRVTF